MLRIKFIEGFAKQAAKRGSFIGKLLYRLSRGLPVRMKGHSLKTIKNTRTGRDHLKLV